MSDQENRIYWILLAFGSVFVWMLIFTQGFMHLSGEEDVVWVGHAACTGGVGGTMAIWSNLYRRLITKDFAPRYVAYYLVMPVAGVVTGTIVYGLVFFSLDFVSFFNSFPNMKGYLLLLSGVVGFRQGERLFNWLSRTKTNFFGAKPPSRKSF